MSVVTYEIEGMTCDRCARTVHEELSKLGGVNYVQVNLETGTATVETLLALRDSEVQAAVDGVGYSLAGR